ncbi:hypothetical protein I3F58_12975 [Streptomyces sp. MUM 203J]|uniref:hypothetical protein n=1 Tax=Streptomyces sp. MUM 203J TaxID=2791990 RepID=UPI001F04885C|nr:hypothetical protein [Streptomyces sp. MUM 203J]MCH0540467.1 hypothetical protein [Streptomyces sp. MUM 203J]
MNERLLTSLQARLLRWLFIAALCSILAALLVMGVTLLLPDDVVVAMSDSTYMGIVVAVTAALSVGVHLLTRRKPPRPPR